MKLEEQEMIRYVAALKGQNISSPGQMRETNVALGKKGSTKIVPRSRVQKSDIAVWDKNSEMIIRAHRN
jgi:hypothetical protein